MKEKEMKLYVVGTRSGKPEDWSMWNELALYLAESKEHLRDAESLHHQYNDHKIHEVDMSKPCLLTKESEPNWGEEL